MNADDYEPEFQFPRACQCADCRSGGAWSYVHGHQPGDCIYASRQSKNSRSCKRCA